MNHTNDNTIFTHGTIVLNRKHIRTTLVNKQLYYVAADVCKALNQSTLWGKPRYQSLLTIIERELAFKTRQPSIIAWKDYENVLTLITESGFNKLRLAAREPVELPKQELKPLKLDKDESLNTNEDLLLSIKDLIDKYTPSRLLIPSEYSTEG